MDSNLIGIDGNYLTSDGTETGFPCSSKVVGLSALKPAFSGKIHRSLDGTPYKQTTSLKGKVVTVTVEMLTAAVYDLLVNLINDAEADSETINLIIEGATGNFDLTVVPNEDWLQFSGEFTEVEANSYIESVSFSFVTT